MTAPLMDWMHFAKLVGLAAGALTAAIALTFSGNLTAQVGPSIGIALLVFAGVVASAMVWLLNHPKD